MRTLGRMSDFHDIHAINAKVIEEFHANDGIVGGQFEGAPVVLLGTTGAKSGQARINPLVYLPDGERIVVFASKGGSPTNPDWYHNIVANPDVHVEVGTESYDATAEIVEGDDRDRLFAAQVAKMPTFGDYAANTDRLIPVVAISRK